MKKCTVIFIATILAIASYSQHEHRYTVYFQTDNYDLKSTSAKGLIEFFNASQLPGNFSVSLSGYTDSRGSETYNFNLAQKRVETVYKIMTENGVVPDKIEKHSFGESMQLDNNDTPEGRAKNRCVEIVLSAVIEQNSPNLFSNINELLESLQEPVQVFSFLPARSAVFETKNHSVIGIPVDAFVIPKSLKGKKVTVSVREVFDKMAMIAHNLQTVSNDYLLETGGMINISAEVEGVSVALKEGKMIDIVVHPVQFDERMEAFEGNRIDHDLMDWEYEDSLQYIDHIVYRYPCDSIMLEKCPFFFCRIKRMFISKSKREELNAFDERQRELDRIQYRKCKAQQNIVREFESRYGSDAYRLMNEIASNARDAKSYLIQSNQLGWHNIDKFVNDPEIKIMALDILNAPHPGTIVQVVLNDRNSVVSAVPDDGKYVVPTIPSGDDFTIVGIRYNVGAPPSIAIMQHNLINGESVTLDFVTCSENKLKEKLSNVNNLEMAVR